MRGMVIAVAAAVLSLGSLVGLPHKNSEAATIEFDVRLTGAQESPAVNSPGSANAHFKFDDVTRELSYSLTVQGLSAEVVTAAHIHRGAPGVNGPVIYPLSDKGFLSVTGKVTLTPDDVNTLRAGGLYANVHSTTYPNGFARGQMVLTPGRPQFGAAAPQFNRGLRPNRLPQFNMPGNPSQPRPQGVQPNRNRGRLHRDGSARGQPQGRPPMLNRAGALGNQQSLSVGPDGRNCNQVRGTEYRSNAERQWYLATCARVGVGR